MQMRSAATNAVNNMLHTDARLDCRSKTAGSAAKAKFETASNESPADRINSSRKPVRQKRPSRRKAAAEAAIAAVVSSATCSAGARYAKLRLATSTSAAVAPAQPSAQPTRSLRNRSTTSKPSLTKGFGGPVFWAGPGSRFGYGIDGTPLPEGHSQPIGRRIHAVCGPL